METDTQLSKVQVCGIGASAGGVAALQHLFERMDPQLNLAYVVILHLDPTHCSQMQQILSHATPMPVHEVSGELELEANHIYVIAPDRELVITDHHVTARPFTEPRGQRAPIDVFFRSLADGQADGMAVILTGAGADGSNGVRAIKEAGGVVFVQEPADAEYPIMPRSAIATGAADIIVPLAGLPQRIAETVRSRMAITLESEDVDAVLHRIITFLRSRTGHDFSSYKRATIFRRVTRRMQVARKETLGDYAEYLAQNPEEAQELFGDLLISVTMFFRDPHAFETLIDKAIEPMLEKRDPDEEIRVWVAGCATGEEAYSIAIVLREALERRDLKCPVQIFATDLDDGALATAREGRYPLSIEADVAEDVLARHFVHETTHYRIRKELREMVLFASHSVIKDPPFMRLDLITCRNLLIYLDRASQRQVCATFHYVLKPEGVLFLGSAENVDHIPELYRTLDRDARLFQPKPQSTRRLPMLGTEREGHVPFVSTAPVRASDREKSAMSAHREALEEIAPPSILVSEDNHVVHISDTAGRFLQPSRGTLSPELPSLVRPELRLDLQTALGRAFNSGQATLTLPLQVAFDGERHRVGMHVRPLRDDDKSMRRALVVFLDGGKVTAKEDGENSGIALSEDPPADLVPRLYEELRQTQDRLSNSRFDHETAVQELRAANEELQSINEEYRSTSEELETSKEELQSINEELQTVNSELKSKLESISTAHSDLRNLVAATDIGTLFLDTALRIKLFTPEVTRHFNIVDADIGRSITDFTHNFVYDGVEREAKALMTDLVPRETVVATRDGCWLLLRLRPYRTVDDRIDGVVISLLDITERRKTEMDLRETTELLSLATAASHLGWGSWERETAFSWDARAQEILDLDAAQTRYDDLMARIHPEDRAKIETLLTNMVAGENFDVAFRIVARDGALRHVRATGTLASDDSDKPKRGTGLLRDVTDEVTWAKSQRLLIGELNHRVKNMLAVVSSIAAQTARHTQGKEDFISALRKRVDALAKAHALLSENNWASTSLSTVVEAMIGAFVEESDRFRVSGPPVHLSPQATLTLTMALHELSTNAAKYGALSVADGTVDIRWELAGPPSARKLNLTWQEHGGPEVAPPERRGFGMRLLTGAAAQELDGDVNVDYQTDGVICRMTFPIEREDFDETCLS